MVGRVEELKEALSLTQHPEGGCFAENYRSNLSTGERSLSTSIYFLLSQGEVSHFHRIKSDELWYFHEGDACIIHAFDEHGKYHCHKLGLNLSNGEQPVVLIPAGQIFASETSNSYSLVSCVVSPGFDFQDFKLFTTSEMLQEVDGYEPLVRKFTKENYS